MRNQPSRRRIADPPMSIAKPEDRPLYFEHPPDEEISNKVFLQREHWGISLVKQLGLPTALLLIMIYGIYQSATWFGAKVMIPLTDRQLEFIDQVDKSVQRVATVVEEHQKNNVLIAQQLEGINAGIRSLNSQTERNGERLQAIETTLNKKEN